MRVLITGANGQLGRALAKTLASKHLLFLHDLDLDVTNESAVFTRLEDVNPDIVIHAAAMTDVDGCELNPNKAFLVNATGTRNIAMACREIPAKLLYVSTDFVFDGKKKTPYKESDLASPVNVYGLSKLAGENHVRELVDDFYIIRTAWLFGEGKNFVRRILELTAREQPLTVVEDQTGSPTYALDLAVEIDKLIETDWYGLYHLTNSGFCTWFEFALAILDLSGMEETEIVPVSSAKLNRAARRPAFSVLDNEALRAKGLPLMRPWREALRDYLAVEQILTENRVNDA